MAGELRFCPQHYGDRPIGEFVGKRGGLVNWCQGCRDLYRSGGRAATRRKRIDVGTELRVLWVVSSMAEKLHGLPATYSSGNTCPDACALKDAGCFAEFGKVGSHWKNVMHRGLGWTELLERVRELKPGTLWRHNVAGDLPGLGDKLDRAALCRLVLANSGRRGFTFTHKPLLDARDRRTVSAANQLGFVINLSADSLEQADEKAGWGIGPVVVTVPSDAARGLRTPAGRHVVLCPAETHRIDCKDCQLCAQPQRKSIVGFRAHGQWHKNIDARLRLPVVAEAAS